MNKKILSLTITIVLVMLFASLVAAQEPQAITAWTDKPEYSRGEKGKLYIAFYNKIDEPVEIRNITITYYAWKAYEQGTWVGNETREYSPVILVPSKGIHTFDDITFVVPTDGRGVSTSVSIKIGTNKGYVDEGGHCYINVYTTPKYMEQITTLFTIQVVLLIVCTIIIAATIFLSARRPSLVWKAEEKAG